MFAINGKTIAYDHQWTHPETGVQYPRDWLRKSTPAQKEAIGLVEVEPPKLSTPGRYVDSRFYVAPDQPKDLDGLKNEFLAKIKESANDQLKSTDWYVIRRADIGALIPEEILDIRGRIRQLCDLKEEVIQGCEDVNELKNYVGSKDFADW